MFRDRRIRRECALSGTRLVFQSVFAALLLSATQDACVDHSSYDFDLAGARFRDVEVTRSEPSGRSETGRFPDGTIVSVSAEYCSDPEIIMDVDAPLDAQTEMRLGQLVGRLDVVAGCQTADWDARDASLAAAAAALDAGEPWNNGGAPIAGSGKSEITLSARVEGGRILATFTCTRLETH